MTAVVAAVTFDANLAGLASHPARYGWNSDVIIQSAGGYAPFDQAILRRQLAGESVVAGWSEYAFTQLPIDGRLIPVLGVQHQAGSVQPPTIGGQPLASGAQIELGSQTLSELGKKPGDTVRIGTGAAARQVTITGTVTLPSFGLATADHVSLGRGAMLPLATLAAGPGPGHRRRGRDLAGPDRAGPGPPAPPRTGPAEDAGHDPGPGPGGRGLADHADPADRGGAGRPAGGGRRVVGVAGLRPLTGRGPVTEVPVLAVFGLLAALVLAGNLLAAVPAALAARTQPAVTLRTE